MRERRPVRSLAPLLALLPLAAAAQERPALERLFPLEASLESDAPGLVRLVLPPAVLAETRPDLSDLRVFDAAGREVPFLVDAARRDAAVVARERFEGEVLGVRRHREENASPERPGDAAERYEIEAPPRPPEGEHWELVVSTETARFVREISVHALAEGEDDTLLVDRASLFRLAPETQRVRVPLPAFRAQRLRVAITGHEPFYLEPAFRFESARRLDAERRSEVSLAEIAREQEGDRTVVELERPAGIVPDRLRLETATGVFHRGVAVWDVQPGRGERRLGATRLQRVGADAAQIEVPLSPARGATLRVEIDDGDSPPLEALRFAAVVSRPALVFELRGARRGTLRFGGGRAHRPRYDLNTLRVGRAPLGGERAEAAALLHDADALPAAHLGPIRPNPGFDAAPALAFAMHPAAALDPRRFEHRRRLVIRPSAEGLSRLRLAPRDVAKARPDLADVRVVDAQGRQWPYLLERRAAAVRVPLARARSSERRVTTVHLALPAAPLPLDRVELRSPLPYFDRPFRLAATGADGREREIARGRLVKEARRPRPPRIHFPAQRVHALVLRIEDGDDAPLALAETTARAWLPELFLVAPAGSYRLLVGDPDTTPPRYELERVRDIVLAVAAAEAEAEPLEANPDFRLAARLTGADGPAPLLQSLLVWTALGIAVAVLGLLTWRMARQEPDGAG